MFVRWIFRLSERMDKRRTIFLLLGLIAVIFVLKNLKTTYLHLRKNTFSNHEKQLLKTYSEKSGGISDHNEKFAERRRNLEQTCNNISITRTASDMGIKSHLIVDDKYKLVYCFVKKNGCTFWMRVFQILNGFKNVTDPFDTNAMEAYGGYKTAENMRVNEVHKALASSTKFMFVRDPYERLLSGYVDKLYLPYAPYWFELGRFIVEKFRRDQNQSGPYCGDDVTFEEFVRYFIFSWKTGIRTDAHFSANYEYCRPCEIQYDYIAKLENFKEETLFLIEKLNLTDKIKFKDFDSETDKDSILNSVDWVFYATKVDNCTTKEKTLFKLYKKMQIRGIISKYVPYPFTDVSSITIDKYKEAMLNAYVQSGPKDKRKLQRKEAFIEAYRTLPQDLFQELQSMLSVDAELFGYEAHPGLLQKADSNLSKYRYFT